MKISTKKVESLSDRDLDRVAAEDEQRKLALAEIDRRAAAKLEADDAKVREAAETSRRKRVKNLSALAARTCDEATLTHEAFVGAVEDAAAFLERRDAILGRLAGLRAELESLGAPRPSPTLKTPSGASEAAARLLPVLQEIASASSPLLGRAGDILARASRS